MDLPTPDWMPSAPENAPLSVWRLRLSSLPEDPTDLLRPLTTPSEHDRARRYRFEADRHRHLAGRALIRLALSRRLGRPPHDVALTEDPHGKPQLRRHPDQRPPLHFNVAHTDDIVVAAISREHPVGIDVEAQARSVEAAELADRVMTVSEREWWRQRPDARRKNAFLHLWTCKEAFLKATGRGLRRAPSTIDCRFDGSTVTALSDAPNSSSPPSSPPTAEWTVQPFLAADGVTGALVHQHASASPLSWIDAAETATRASTT